MKYRVTINVEALDANVGDVATFALNAIRIGAAEFNERREGAAAPYIMNTHLSPRVVSVHEIPAADTP